MKTGSPNKPQPLEIAPSPAAVFDEHLAEIDQAKTRLWMTVASIIYVALKWAIGGNQIHFSETYIVQLIPVPDETALHLLGFFVGYGVFGLIVLAIIRLYPGHNVARRLSTIVADFAALTYTMIVGGNAMMPFYALILWVAVGNGMRFGIRYLLFSTVLAQVSLAALAVFSPFWHNRVDVIVTFSITALALPFYSVALLRQTARARDAALEATQAKSRFLAQASHDLRQPVHAIGYYLDILREENSQAERAQLIKRIERSLGAVARLFKSLLDIARIDSGTIEQRISVIALQPLLADIIQQNEKTAQWYDVDLRLVRTSLYVRADQTLLETMIQNLLSNAIKYARGSSVLIGVRRHQGTAAIEIHDQGIGIDPEHMPHIFDEFYRAHVAGEHDSEGVGLGLAIVQRLSQLSGFRLNLRSRRGVGTVAGIYGILTSAGETAQPDRRSRNEAPQPLSGFRVILIEDDRDVLEATQQLLRRWGCTVQAFSEAPRSVAAADLIIADFDLGFGLLGTDAIGSIREQLGCTVPAILMTGHAEALVREQPVADDIQILAKPVQPTKLRSVVSSFRIAGRDQA